jgi:hypothetical protein
VDQQWQPRRKQRRRPQKRRPQKRNNRAEAKERSLDSHGINLYHEDSLRGIIFYGYFFRGPVWKTGARES